ncbi:MAG: hypothetical protein ACOYB3_11530 [Azonexus sp.]
MKIRDIVTGHEHEVRLVWTVGADHPVVTVRGIIAPLNPLYFKVRRRDDVPQPRLDDASLSCPAKLPPAVPAYRPLRSWGRIWPRWKNFGTAIPKNHFSRLILYFA